MKYKLPGDRPLASRLAGAVLVGVTASAGAAGAAGSDLLPFEASYNFSYKGMNAAVTTLILTHGEGDHWTYRSAAEARGIFRALPIDNPAQSSEMRINGDGVRPLHFVQSNGANDDRAISLSFDWDAQRVTGTLDRKSINEVVPPDTQDDLSIQIALIRALARGDSSGTFRTFGDRGLREYRFHTDGEETLKTPLGDVATRILVTERAGSPRVTRYWCAPSFGFLPLRVQQKRLEDVEWTLEVRSLKRG